MISNTPQPPYYAVIFTSIASAQQEGYKEMADHMEKLAQDQPGFLGLEAAREELGVTVSYWRDLESIKNWKANMDHQAAQEKGKSTWYKAYKTRIALVERDYGFGL